MRADDRDPRDDRVDELFSSLRSESAPEIDTEAAWRRLRAALPERQPSLGWGRPAWGLPLAAAAVLFLAVALVLQSSWWTGTAEVQPGDSDFVLLAGDEPRESPEPALEMTDAESTTGAETAPVLPPAGYTLEVRLLRAVEQAQGPALGAGGSDPLADLRALLNSVTPDRAYEIAGSWSGELTGGTVDADLDEARRLSFEVDPDDPTRLLAVRFGAGSGQSVADELSLRAGQPYLFGVRDASGETGEILLSFRLRRVGEPLDPRPRDPEPRH